MKNTLKSAQGFSLVELLVVIAVIAVIAAIAIPNITGITGSAQRTAAQRTAQNLASLASAATAAGQTNVATNAAVSDWVTALTGDGITVMSGTNVLGSFRADAVSGTNYLEFLSVTNGVLTYTP